MADPDFNATVVLKVLSDVLFSSFQSSGMRVVHQHYKLGENAQKISQIYPSKAHNY